MRPITASDLMNPEVLTASDDMTLAELAVFLLDNEISGAPVSNRAGQLIGVVSVVDIARIVADEPAGQGNGGEAGTVEERARRTLVADVMTPEVYSVSEDASVSEVAATMIDNHLHRLVVTRDNQPIGIISSSDLLGLLVDDDEK
jgi:CBS domain-containing protein